MKPSFKIETAIALMLCLCIFSCNSENSAVIETASIPSDSDEIAYDAEKAKAYGADEYGMKAYVMAFLKKGPNRDLDSTRAAELQMAHLNNINRMAEDGKLILAGPFMGDGDLRGIYVFDVPTIEEAEALTNSDPAIQAGSLEMELVQWYGSAALLALNDIHKSLQKQGITD